MFVNNDKISKIIFNYQKYNNFLSFKIKNKGLYVIGFFGEISLVIPSNIVVEINHKTQEIFLFFYSNQLSTLTKVLKSFYSFIMFSSYGVILGHFTNLTIKGIGYKFSLDKNDLIVHNGMVVPRIFEIPKNVTVLDNGSSNILTVMGGDYTFLSNFVSNIRKTSIPNRYKEIGIFVDKKL